MSVLSQPTPQISVGPPPTLTYQVSVTNGQAYTLTVFQTINGADTVVVSPTAYTGTGSLQTYTFTSPVTSYSYYTRVTIGATTTNSTSVLYYSPYQGPQGVQGNPGAAGQQGPLGPVGPQGPQGLQGVVSVTNYVTCNSLITSGTSSGTVNANANLTFNGTTLNVTGNVTTTSTGSNQIGGVVLSNNLIRIGNGNTFTRMTGSYYTPSPYNSDFFITNNIASFTSNSTDILSLTTDWPGGATAIRLIAPYNAAGAIALCVGTNGGVPTNVMMVTPTGVGIGTSTPAYTLDVNGTIRGTLVGNQATFQADPSGAIWYYSTDGQARLRFGSNGSSTLAAPDKIIFQTPVNTTMTNITSSGMRVGDGTTASYMLDVVGTIKSSSDFVVNQNNPNTIPVTLCNNTGSVFQVLQAGGDGSWLNGAVAGDSIIRSFGKLMLAAGSNNPNATITLGNSNGFVGIGTTAPAYTLDVGGTTRAKSLLGTLTNTGAIAPVSPFAAQNGNDYNVYSPQVEFQHYSGGYTHYIGTRHAGGVTNDNRNAIDFWLYSGATQTSSTTPGTGNVNMMSVTAAGVGINCNEPQTALDVKGSGRFVRSGRTSLVVGNTAGAYFAVDTGTGGYAGLIMNGYFQVALNGGTSTTIFNIPSDGNGNAWYSNGSGNFGIGTTTPGYKLDVNGNANFGPAAGGALYVGTAEGLLVYGASNGHGYIRADMSTTSSDKILFLGTGQSNNVEINRSNVVFYPSNAVYVKSNAGSGNFVVEGTSYLKDISNTNVYSTGALVSGTTAGRLVMVGVQNGCYIEAGLNSDTGSAAPLYFTDMSNSNQWMCIGSTGNVGINNNSPVGRFHVRTSGNALDTFLGWDSTWMVVTPSANATTAKNTPGLGLGYNVASNIAYIAALAPNDAWKDLELDGSNIRLVPHGGDVKVSGTLRSDNFITVGTATVAGIKASGTSLTTTVVNGGATGSNVISVGLTAGSTLTFAVNLGTFMCALSLRSASGYYTGVAYFDPRGPTFQAMNPGYAATFTQSSSGQNLIFSNLSGSVNYHFICYCVSST